MDCRYVKNEKLYEIIQKRINKYIEELNQAKKSDKVYRTYSFYPFQICENDIHIVKIRAMIIKGYDFVGDMFTFAIFSKETELDEIINSLTLEKSEITFEISESTILICEITRSPYYYRSSLYLSLVPDSIDIQPNDRIINIIPSDGIINHIYVALEQKREDKDKLIIFEIPGISVLKRKKLNIFKIRDLRKYINVEQEDNKKVGNFKKISNFFSSLFSRSDNNINNNYIHLKSD